MWRYVVRRLVGAALVLWLVSIFVFVVIRALPGDAVLSALTEGGRGVAVSQADLDAAREELGLNEPIVVAYLQWAGGFLVGDLGMSLVDRQAQVSTRIVKSLNPTIELAILAALIGLPIALGLGIVSAVRQDTVLDYPLRLVAIVGISVPSFVLATALLTFTSITWGYAPQFGWVPLWEDPARNLGLLYMPALILAFNLTGTVTRMTRSAVLEVIREDYVRTAHSKGLAFSVVLRRHILRNALISVTTLVGLQLAFLLSGSLILEVIFALPGVGQLTFTAIQQRDYPQIMANTMFFATVVVAMNLIVDLIYGVLDPRVHYA
ncbi:MAG: ABC transporter permease [Chloroflexi bacterium]|nr:ABC transporter permease [Chloroflexota bacterium]MDA1004046.1 ABC transporter permease [Chloroflexota bacterium]